MIRTRLARVEDVGFLWSMLFYAAHADEQPGATVDSIKRDPDLDRYLRGWPRAGDLGFVAFDDGSPVGAAWLRLFTDEETRLVTFVALEIPELSIAVLPDRLGEGIGSLLLDRLLSEADTTGVPAIVLSARADNLAVPLYERHGFAEIDRIVNRVGTESVRMLRQRRDDSMLSMPSP